MLALVLFESPLGVVAVATTLKLKSVSLCSGGVRVMLARFQVVMTVLAVPEMLTPSLRLAPAGRLSMLRLRVSAPSGSVIAAVIVPRATD